MKTTMDTSTYHAPVNAAITDAKNLSDRRRDGHKAAEIAKPAMPTTTRASIHRSDSGQSQQYGPGSSIAAILSIA
jgi:hypothetical protein